MKIVEKEIVRFRDLEAADKDALRLIRSDKYLQHMLMAYPPDTYIDDIDVWVGKKKTTPNSYFKIISKHSNNACLGFVQIKNIHFRSKHGYLGIAIHPNEQGNGYGYAAIQKLISIANEQYSLHKLLLEVREDNKRAISLYLVNGFHVVGVLKEHYIQNVKWIDVVIMEKLL